MKIKLHWQEESLLVRTYPDFILDSKEFPELELEIQNVYEAQRGNQDLEKPLDDLIYKMETTEVERICGDSADKVLMSISNVVRPWGGFAEASEEEFEGDCKLKVAERVRDEESGS
jgi:hypothetical protein